MKIEDLCCVRIIDFSLLWPKSRRQKIATSIGNSLVSKYVLSITSLRFALASTLRLCSDGWWSCLPEHDYVGSFWAPICGGLGLATCAAFENGRYIFIGFAPRFAHCQRSRVKKIRFRCRVERVIRAYNTSLLPTLDRSYFYVDRVLKLSYFDLLQRPAF